MYLRLFICMTKQVYASRNCLEQMWAKSFWLSDYYVDYLILEADRHLVTMVLGILLACCLAVIIILFLIRIQKHISEHRKGTVRSPECILSLYLEAYMVLWHLSYVLTKSINILLFLFSGTVSASYHVPHDSVIQGEEVHLFNTLLIL